MILFENGAGDGQPQPQAAGLGRVEGLHDAGHDVGRDAHAGVDDRVTCVVGTIGDGGRTLDALANEYGFDSGTLDFVFLDHDKDAYLDDLHSILERGWLHPGSIVMADNVQLPGAPKYREYMRQQQGTLFNTVEHKAHAEYQSLATDLVLESDYLG